MKPDLWSLGVIPSLLVPSPISYQSFLLNLGTFPIHLPDTAPTTSNLEALEDVVTSENESRCAIRSSCRTPTSDRVHELESAPPPTHDRKHGHHHQSRAERAVPEPTGRSSCQPCLLGNKRMHIRDVGHAEACSMGTFLGFLDTWWKPEPDPTRTTEPPPTAWQSKFELDTRRRWSERSRDLEPLGPARQEGKEHARQPSDGRFRTPAA